MPPLSMPVLTVFAAGTIYPDSNSLSKAHRPMLFRSSQKTNIIPPITFLTTSRRDCPKRKFKNAWLICKL